MMFLKLERCPRCGKKYSQYAFHEHHVKGRVEKPEFGQTIRIYEGGIHELKSGNIIRICANCHSILTEAQKEVTRLHRHIRSPPILPELRHPCPICGWGGEIEEVQTVIGTFLVFQQLIEHHIIPIAEGGSNEKWNKLLLCPNCHAIVHRDPIVREGIRQLMQVHIKHKDSQIFLNILIERFGERFIVK